MSVGGKSLPSGIFGGIHTFLFTQVSDRISPVESLTTDSFCRLIPTSLALFMEALSFLSLTFSSVGELIST